jgi:copper transport protein
MTNRLGLSGAALFLSLAAASTAGAHAFLARADPAPGSVVSAERPPARLVLRFTEAVTVGRDAVVVLDGAQRRVGPIVTRVADGDRLEVETPTLAPGVYVVRWGVTSADSHVVRGAHWFSVGFASSPPAPETLSGTTSPAVPPLEVLARWLALVATLGLAGRASFEMFAPRNMAAPGSASRWRPAVFVLLLVLVVAELGRAAAQASAVAELPLRQALDASTLRATLSEGRFAALWWARLALGGVLAALIARRRTSSAAVVALLLLVATAAAGHAVSGALPRVVTLTADVVHLAAAALWLGGLAYVGVGVARGDARPAPSAAMVTRLSTVALVSVLALTVTGAINALAQVGRFAALPNTAYGQGLAVKLALLVPWLGLAAVNRFALRPRVVRGGDPRARARLSTLVRAELGLAVATLLVVGVLGSLPPPATRPWPAPVESARQAGPLRIALRVDPNWVGVSRVRVTLSERSGQPPVGIRRVVLTFTMDGMNMGRTHVALEPRGDGRWETEGFFVGMPGLSQVGVAVTRDAGPDTGAVFRIEVPDTSAGPRVGLVEALGLRGAPARLADGDGVARGREVYAGHCALCHGDTGTGGGPAAASLLPPPADLTLHARWHADEQLFWFISRGLAGTSMPGFADRLSPRERRDTIAYLRTLAAAPTATAPRPAPGPPAPAATSPPGDPPAPQLAQPTAARSPAGEGPAGRFVYGPDFDNNLWVLRLPAGESTGLTRLGPLEFSSHPAWAPDGTRLAFAYYRLPGGDAIPVPDGTDLYVMSAAGGTPRLLAAHGPRGAALQHPAWSADGATLYASAVGPGGADLGIDRVEVTTGLRRRVVDDAQFPTLSRDGRRLAYVRFTPLPARGQSLWWSAVSGSGAQQIVGSNTFEKLFSPRFAPDGRRLLFAAVGQPASRSSRGFDALGLVGRVFRPAPALANGDLWDLWTVDVDGRNLRPLTALGEDLPVGAWSPDGAYVAFLGGGSSLTAEAGITVLGTGGTVWRRLTAQPGHRGLDWARP